MGSLPLHIAAASGSKACLEYFLRNGFSPNLRDSHQNTALHKAIFESHLDCAELLIKEYKADINATNKDGISPLHKGVGFD